jgi:hypothetical protein
MDDGVFLGPPEKVKELYEDVTKKINAVGLAANPKKSFVYCPRHSELENPAAFYKPFTDMGMQVSGDGMEMLGLPVSSSDLWTTEWLVNKIEEVTSELFPALRGLIESADDKTTQALFHVIRMCVIPRFNHFTRGISPDITKPVLQAVDDQIQEMFLALIDATWPSQTDRRKILRMKIQLPIGKGGIGLRSLVCNAEAAWVGSMLLSLPEMLALAPDTVKGLGDEGQFVAWENVNPTLPMTLQLHATVQELKHNKLLSSDFSYEMLLEESTRTSWQHEISKAITAKDEALLSTVLQTGQNASLREFACFKSGACHIGYAWLLSVPAWWKHATTRFKRDEFITAVRAKLHLGMHPEGETWKCTMHPGQKANTEHLLTCFFTTTRHNDLIRDGLRPCLTKAGLRYNQSLANLRLYNAQYPTLSVFSLKTTNNPTPHQLELAKGKMADIRIDELNGATRYVDATVVHPAWESLARAKQEGLGVAEAEAGKDTWYAKWFNVHEKEHVKVDAFGAETCGRLGNQATALLQEIVDYKFPPKKQIGPDGKVTIIRDANNRHFRNECWLLISAALAKSVARFHIGGFSKWVRVQDGGNGAAGNHE